MRARVTVALFVALLIQFIGGEIIFNRFESAQTQQGRARFVADHLAIASRLIAEGTEGGEGPDAETMGLMNRLWQGRLAVGISKEPPPPRLAPESEELALVRARILKTNPGIADGSLRLLRNGRDLDGAFQLKDGAWLHFRSSRHFQPNPMLLHYATSGALLIGCVVLMALLFGRMVDRPLRRLVDAAEKVDRDEPVAVDVSGPREVRQVAGAFEAMQARLLAHVRERVQSLAAMSHDLRTPLARLRLNASMVKDGELRTAIEDDVREMEAFVSSVLAYLRGDEAEAEQHVDVASILMTIVDEARDLGEQAEYDGPDRLETVTRPIKLKRMVRNLVQNAGRYAGNARVRLSREPEEIVITVEDDGPGIAPADMETIFEPFARRDTSRSRKTGGAGLGLAIVQRLAGRLDGSIELCNRAEGGLGVTIRLPFRPAGS